MKIEEYRNLINQIKLKPYFKIGRLLNHDLSSKVLHVVSLHTPCEIKLPAKIDMAFLWTDLNERLKVNLTVESAIYSGRVIKEIPLGHSCEIKLKYEKWNPILDSIKRNKEGNISIGICSKSNWELVNYYLTETKKNRIPNEV